MKNKIVLMLRLIATAILFQTLFFKFTGAAESKFIFNSLGVEPWGRWIAGLSELVAGVLLLITPTQILGAAMALGIMTGALMSHILILGIVVRNDQGMLFSLACIVFMLCATILLLQRHQMLLLVRKGQALLQMLRG